MKIAIVGVGRAGSSFATALRHAGHDVLTFHHDQLDGISLFDLVLLCVPDDELVVELVRSLDGTVLRLSDDQRALYHATASVAANHMVALLGHVEVLAEATGLSLEDFLPLVDQALSDVRALGASRALTGPASRADMATIDAHLDAIPESERSTYVAMANAAFELAEQRRLTSHA